MVHHKGQLHAMIVCWSIKKLYILLTGWDKKLSSVLYRLSEDGQLCLPASVNKKVCQRVKTRHQDGDHTASESMYIACAHVH